MSLRVYSTQDLQQNQKIGMHLVANENTVYFIDTDNITQTILMRLSPMYVTDSIETVDTDTRIMSFLWKNNTPLDFVDKDACEYFKLLLPDDKTNVVWLPSVKPLNDIEYFFVPISENCTSFDQMDNIIDIHDCFIRGNLVETIIAVKGFRYYYENETFTCEIIYEIFQAKLVDISIPKLEKHVLSLFST